MPGIIKITMSGDSADIDKKITEIFKSKAEVEAAIKTSVIESNATMAEVQTDIQKLEQDTAIAAMKAKLTITNTLFALRSLSDVIGLYSAITGDVISTQYLSMISMGLSAVIQLKLMAAVYATTPGMQPFAMAMLAMIPVLTGFIMFLKTEHSRAKLDVQSAIDKQSETLIDGIKM